MIARPGHLQQQTGWRMLSGMVPLEKRFDPSGPYAKAFEAGGWDNYLTQLKDERKKQKQENELMRNVLYNLPRIANWMSRTGRQQYEVAKPPEEEY